MFPGETIRTEMWRDGRVVSFRARVVERDVIALNNGRAEIAADASAHRSRLKAASSGRIEAIAAFDMIGRRPPTDLAHG